MEIPSKFGLARFLSALCRKFNEIRCKLKCKPIYSGFLYEKQSSQRKKKAHKLYNMDLVEYGKISDSLSIRVHLQNAKCVHWKKSGNGARDDVGKFVFVSCGVIP